MRVGSLGRGFEPDRVTGLCAWSADDVDDVIVDHNRGHDHVRAAFAGTVGEEGRVNEHAAGDLADAFPSHALRDLPDGRERIAFQGGSVVGMVLVHERQGPVGLDAVGKIRIAAGNQDEIALELTFFVERTKAIDAGMKAKVRAKLGEQSALRECFGGRGGDKEFLGIVLVDDLSGVQGEKLDAEIGVREFRASHDLIDARFE